MCVCSFYTKRNTRCRASCSSRTLTASGVRSRTLRNSALSTSWRHSTLPYCCSPAVICRTDACRTRSAQAIFQLCNYTGTDDPVVLAFVAVVSAFCTNLFVCTAYERGKVIHTTRCIIQKHAILTPRGNLTALPRPLSWIKGPTSKGRGRGAYF